MVVCILLDKGNNMSLVFDLCCSIINLLLAGQSKLSFGYKYDLSLICFVSFSLHPCSSEICPFHFSEMVYLLALAVAVLAASAMG